MDDREQLKSATDATRRVLTLAEEEARSLGHNYLGLEHLLLGLAREEEDATTGVLSDLGVRVPQLRAAVTSIVGRGVPLTVGVIAPTPRTQKMLASAVAEADRTHHHTIAPEHLLLGLVQEGAGIAAEVLRQLGIDLEQVRTRVVKSPPSDGTAHFGAV